MKPELSQKDYLFQGVLPVLAASVLWAVGYFIRKLILADISPLTLATINALVVVLFLFAVFRPDPKALLSSLRLHLWKFIALSLSGSVLGMILMFYGLMYLDLGVTTLLEKLQPLFTLALAAFLLGEKFPRRLLPFCGVAILASYLVVTSRPFALDMSPDQIRGYLCVIGTAFFWALASIIGRSLMQTGLRSSEVTIFRFLIGFVILLPFFLYEQGGIPDLAYSPRLWLAIVFAAIVSTGCGYLLYYRGLRHVSVSTSAFLEMITPLVGLGLGIILLGETLAPLQLLAIPALIYSIYKISAARY